MDNTDKAADIISSLKSHKIKLGLDDFGTGYSSLSYRHRFPVDTLKYDLYFVSRMDQASENTAIIKTVEAMAQNMELKKVE